jgi:cell division protease FtsH
MKELVAYHEAGHAVIGALMPDYDMVQKVTIIPRSNGAGGLTFFSPNENRLESGLYSRQYLEAQLAVALGGRLAEELIFGEDQVTTGASNDIEQVANIANRMITQWGMSEKIGPQIIGPWEAREVNGGEPGVRLERIVDDEVQRVVNNAYFVGKKLLQENMSLLEALAQKLLEQETVTAEELSLMVAEHSVSMAPYDIYGQEINNDKLPFQKQPELAAVL